MLCLSGFELYSRWVPLIHDQSDLCCAIYLSLLHATNQEISLDLSNWLARHCSTIWATFTTILSHSWEKRVDNRKF